jgi:integrase/recombinase XerC
MITALRCLYRRAEEDGLITAADNPAKKVDKPRRPPSTRRAVADTRLAEIVQVAATTGDDPALDALILRRHIETAVAAAARSHCAQPISTRTNA